MAKRTAWIYAGLPHTGGPAVAGAAAAQAATLAAQGVGLPATSPEQMRRATADLLHDHRELGLRRRDVEGAWAEICRRAWRDKRAPLLGHERLAAADADQVALLLDGLAGLRPRVVIALRDPARLLTEGWAAEVREGRATTFERYAERVLDPDEEHAQATRFRAAHDVAGVLDRWTAALGPDRVNVVVLPPDRDPGQALWGELLGLLGIEADPLVPAPASWAGTDGPATDGAATAAGLREVNAALKGRLSREGRRELLSDWFPPAGAPGSGATPHLPGELPGVLPGELAAEVTALAEKWRARVAEAGVPVRGDLDDLVPASGPVPDRATGREHAAGPTAEALTLTARALGEAALEVADLRGRVADLERRNARLERKRSALKRRLRAG